MKFLTFCSAVLLAAGAFLTADDKKAAGDTTGWTILFDGKSLDGWKANDEDKDGKVFSVQNGELVVKGGRAHLFYVGKDGKATFNNFAFHAKVMTKKGANSGLYFHTGYQATGWPSKGYEAQVNNSYDKDPRKSGSLYAVKDVLEKVAKDDEWMDYDIKVEGKKVTICINGKCLVEYEEKPDDKRDADKQERWLKGGTFAIQAHDPTCEVHYKDIRVKPLP